ncbi:MAG: Do family serine endopeptidase [Geminicoccaceae bacterium]
MPGLPRRFGVERTVGEVQQAARRSVLGVLVAVLGIAAAGCADAQGSLPVEGFADLVERVSPAVVNISTTRSVAADEMPDLPVPQFPPGSPFEEFFRDFFENRRDQQQQLPREASSLGSGFVIDPEGFVVTNNHVVGEADEITVIFNDESSYEAELIGRDPKTDLALLKIERDEPFPHVDWADSDTVRVGNWMVAIGNPFGLGSTVTAGIISARGRDIRAGPYDDFLQVDAAINRGNSGGPSFNIDGQVIGVNTAIFSPSGGNVGIGFAIPSNLARPVIDSLKRFGRVKRGWLGVRIQTVTDDIAESLGLPGSEGALVAAITPDGPADAGGIRQGDVILQFDNKTVDRMRSLPRIVAETEIDKEVDVLIWRDGEEITLQVAVGEFPEDEELAALESPLEEAPPGTAGEMAIDELGLTVVGIDDAARELYELSPDTEGVLIVKVDGNTQAAEEGIQPGDVIIEVGQDPVGSPPEVLAKINEARSENKNSVLIFLDQSGDRRFVALRLRDTG